MFARNRPSLAQSRPKLSQCRTSLNLIWPKLAHSGRNSPEAGRANLVRCWPDMFCQMMAKNRRSRPTWIDVNHMWDHFDQSWAAVDHVLPIPTHGPNFGPARVFDPKWPIWARKTLLQDIVASWPILARHWPMLVRQWPETRHLARNWQIRPRDTGQVWCENGQTPGMCSEFGQGWPDNILENWQFWARHEIGHLAGTRPMLARNPGQFVNLLARQ